MLDSNQILYVGDVLRNLQNKYKNINIIQILISAGLVLWITHHFQKISACYFFVNSWWDNVFFRFVLKTLLYIKLSCRRQTVVFWMKDRTKEGKQKHVSRLTVSISVWTLKQNLSLVSGTFSNIIVTYIFLLRDRYTMLFRWKIPLNCATF